MPFIVGLTGGIGSGKSTVASCFAEHGATVIDADEISRSLTARGSLVLNELQDVFGVDIIDEHGDLKRPLLAERAFATEEKTIRLNEIMHARIREKALSVIDSLPNDVVVVYDMPLLVETNSVDMCDYVVVVDASEELRRERLVSSRNMTNDDVSARMARQASSAERNSFADVVITNDGDLAFLGEQCDRAWEDIRRRASGSGERILIK